MNDELPAADAEGCATGGARRRRKRLAVLAAVGTVAILCAAFYVHFYVARPVGSGPADPQLERSAFLKPWSDRKVRLAGLCDIYDPTDGVGDAPSVYLPDWPDGLAIHARYNQVIRECAGKFSNVHVVLIHQTFMGHGVHCRKFWRSTYVSEDPRYWYFTNVEDPNDRGHDAVRRVFLKTIVERSELFPREGGE
jgi:hypothetical protein